MWSRIWYSWRIRRTQKYQTSGITRQKEILGLNVQLTKVTYTLPITQTENKLLNELVKDFIAYRLEEKEAMQYIAIRYEPISLS